MSGGWGPGSYGSSSWGGGSAALGLVAFGQVYAISTNEIYVAMTGPILQRSEVLVGDATNPATWIVTRLDTGEQIQIIAVTPQSSSIIVLRALITLPTTQVQLQLVAPTLLDATGSPVSSTSPPPFSGMTEGAYATPDAIATTKTTSARDLLNQTTNTPDGSSSASGTLVIGGGDYKNEQGTSLVKKLIIRRLLAVPGDFMHLPTYGCGLRAKQFIPAGDLVTLQATIKQQIMMEREVDTVAVQLSMTSNTLFVQLAVTLKATGAKLSMSVPFAMGNGNGGSQ